MDKDYFFPLKFKLQWFLKANESKLLYSGGYTKWWHKILLQKNEQTSQNQKIFLVGMKFDILIN